MPCGSLICRRIDGCLLSLEKMKCHLLLVLFPFRKLIEVPFGHSKMHLEFFIREICLKTPEQVDQWLLYWTQVQLIFHIFHRHFHCMLWTEKIKQTAKNKDVKTGLVIKLTVVALAEETGFYEDFEFWVQHGFQVWSCRNQIWEKLEEKKWKLKAHSFTSETWKSCWNFRSVPALHFGPLLIR